MSDTSCQPRAADCRQLLKLSFLRTLRQFQKQQLLATVYACRADNSGRTAAYASHSASGAGPEHCRSFFLARRPAANENRFAAIDFRNAKNPASFAPFKPRNCTRSPLRETRPCIWPRSFFSPPAARAGISQLQAIGYACLAPSIRCDRTHLAHVYPAPAGAATGPCKALALVPPAYFGRSTRSPPSTRAHRRLTPFMHHVDARATRLPES